MVTAGKPIASLRWWIGGLLSASTLINCIDRQTLSLLAPYFKIEYQWSNSDYANIAIAFRAAYSIGQTVFGRLMNRIGTRRGLTLTVIWNSLVSMLTFIIAKASTDTVFFFHHGVVPHLPGCKGISRMDICIRAKRRDWESTMTRSWVESFHTSGRTCREPELDGIIFNW